jgi:hypothetical protein
MTKYLFSWWVQAHTEASAAVSYQKTKKKIEYYKKTHLIYLFITISLRIMYKAEKEEQEFIQCQLNENILLYGVCLYKEVKIQSS